MMIARRMLLVPMMATIPVLLLSRDAAAVCSNSTISGKDNGTTSVAVVGLQSAITNGMYGVIGSVNSICTTNNPGVVAGVLGTASGKNGVYGYDSNGGYGVQGVSTASPGTGVAGTGYNYGVYGNATGAAGIGVYGSSSSAQGVKGYTSSASKAGVWGDSSGTNGYGVYGSCNGTGCISGYFAGKVTIAGDLTVNGSCGACSDSRLKKDVEPLSGAIDKLLKLRGVSFKWIDPAKHNNNDTSVQTGFIAQDVEEVFP